MRLPARLRPSRPSPVVGPIPEEGPDRPIPKDDYDDQFTFRCALAVVDTLPEPPELPVRRDNCSSGQHYPLTEDIKDKKVDKGGHVYAPPDNESHQRSPDLGAHWMDDILDLYQDPPDDTKVDKSDKLCDSDVKDCQPDGSGKRDKNHKGGKVDYSYENDDVYTMPDDDGFYEPEGELGCYNYKPKPKPSCKSFLPRRSMPPRYSQACLGPSEPAPPAYVEPPRPVPFVPRVAARSFRNLSRLREFLPPFNGLSLGTAPGSPPPAEDVDTSPTQPPRRLILPSLVDARRRNGPWPNPLVGFEYDAYPHLLDIVMQHASLDTLMTLRLTCRELCRRASVILFGHLVLMSGNVLETARFYDVEPRDNILPLPPLRGPLEFARPPIRGRWPGYGLSRNPDRRNSAWYSCTSTSWRQLAPLVAHTRVVDIMGQDVVWSNDWLLEELCNVETMRCLWGPNEFLAPPQQEVPDILPPRLYLYGSGITARRLVLDGRIVGKGVPFVKKHAALVDMPHIERVIVNLSYTPDWRFVSGMIWTASERVNNRDTAIGRREVVVVLHNSPRLRAKEGKNVFRVSLHTLAQDMARAPHIRYTLVGATEVPHTSIGFTSPPAASEIRDSILNDARRFAAKEGVPWGDDVCGASDPLASPSSRRTSIARFWDAGSLPSRQGCCCMGPRTPPAAVSLASLEE